MGDPRTSRSEDKRRLPEIEIIFGVRVDDITVTSLGNDQESLFSNPEYNGTYRRNEDVNDNNLDQTSSLRFKIHKNLLELRRKQGSIEVRKNAKQRKSHEAH